jgi:signal recognition particle subunit SRP54
MAQIQQVKKMGHVKDLLGMIPGMSKAMKNIDIDDNAFVGIESIIQSMTPKERANPSIINGSRRSRIARGSGRTVEDVNRLLKQFEEMKKVMGHMARGGGIRVPGMKMPGRMS